MFPILQVGPIAVQTPGLIIMLGLWLGLLLSEKFCSRRGFPQTHLYNLIFTGLIVGVIGGRLLYFLRFPDAFLRSPLSIFSINPGLFLLEDGIFLGLIAMWVYGHRKHLKFWETLDVLTPFLVVQAIAIGFAHIASGAAFGLETGLPWGIQLWGALRHPTQIIETISAIAILFLLWPSWRLLGWLVCWTLFHQLHMSFIHKPIVDRRSERR